MLKNHLKIAFRNIIRKKTYSLINILGLSIGMACCLLIFLFVQQELSYDRFHENVDQIYRMEMQMKLDIGDKHYTIIHSDIAPAIKNEFPEVSNAVRLSSQSLVISSNKEKKFKTKSIFVDPDFFDVFTFPLLRGEKTTILTEPNTVVITEALSKKYFGDTNPLDEIIRYNKSLDLRVTGVIRDIPNNSHFKADLIASYSSLRGIYGDNFQLVNTYLLLHKDTDPEILESKLPGFVEKHISLNYS